MEYKRPPEAHIYYNGKVIHTVIGYQGETEQELWYRVRQDTLVVVPSRKETEKCQDSGKVSG